MEILFRQPQLDLGERHDQLVEFHQVGGLVDQCDLEQAVVPPHIGQCQELRHRGRVGYHAVEELVLDHAAVVLNAHPVRPDLRQLGNGVEQVSGVSQQVLELLRRLIGDIRECAACSHIGEVFVVEAAHIAAEIFAVDDAVYGCLRFFGNAQSTGKIVG